MLDENDAVDETATQTPQTDAPQAEPTEPEAAPAKPVRRRAPRKKAAAAKPAADADVPGAETAAPDAEPVPEPVADASAATTGDPVAAPDAESAAPAPKKKAAAKKKSAGTKPKKAEATEDETAPGSREGGAGDGAASTDAEEPSATAAATALLFQAPESTGTPKRRRSASDAQHARGVEQDEPGETSAGDTREAGPGDAGTDPSGSDASGTDDPGSEEDTDGDDSGEDGGSRRRPRRRGGRRRRKPGGGNGQGDGSSQDGQDGDGQDREGQDGQGQRDGQGQKGGKGQGSKASDDESNADSDEGTDSDDGGSGDGQGGSANSRRRRRRRRADDAGDSSTDDPENTVTRTRRTRNPEDEITALSGSTRLEAKKQRRREGREAGRRRAPIVSEAEFLARRESVDRVMAIRQREGLTQIGVLEDKVLVEHYVARESQTSLIGNVYLGRVQNVLPSMEAAFIDIGKGRNAVLYAGEVNWAALGHKDGQPRKIESVLSSGQTVLVQVTKDPVGHKGARLTSQVSLPGRFLVYVPDGNTSGISRKLPDTERTRLKTLLKEIVPDTAGVIVRTAAEGASEDELTLDVERLTARWADIEKKVAAGQAPQLLYGEPDLTLKVVRDLFTEDFGRLVIQGDDAWDLVENYVSHVAPDLHERVERYRPEDEDNDGRDLFASYRIDEQIAKGLDRKVWLPSGGSLIIDRTEAMTVVDVNTGKFTGSGGNLEETVTKNNLEAAEEIVRQLRLRDIGGIIVVDFIDMVLESNRDLVLRRLVECLGRDRTRHQVAEVTSLGLVQMTRKRIGTGLLEAFSHDCEHCKGRGVVVEDHPVEQGGGGSAPDEARSGRGRRGRGRRGGAEATPPTSHHPSPKDLAHSRPPAPGTETDREDGHDDASEPSTDSGSPVTPDATSPDAGAAAEAEPAATTEPETPAQAEVPEPAAPAAPEPPRLVTTSRRRSARRPAGPPVDREVAPTAAEVAVDAPEPSDPASSEVGTPSDADTADGASVADALPDSLAVDSTPDGEPGTDPEADAVLDEADPDGAQGEEHDEAHVLHVPVKRKGSRKR